MNKNLALPEHMRHLAAGIVLAAALTGCAQTAHMDVAVGSVVTPGNTQVPLPPGNWQKLAEQKITGGPNTGGGENNSHHIEAYYELSEKDHLKALIYFNTSADATTSGGYNSGTGCWLDNSPKSTYLHVTVHTPLPSGCQLRGDAGQR